MIALDTNVLVYAHRGEMPEHQRAVDVVTQLLTGNEPVAFCWPVLHEFIAIVTNPRIFKPPTPARTALEQVEHWLSSPRAVLFSESARHFVTLSELIVVGDVRGAIIHDARIAAICVDHGVRELLTSDRDFTKFSSLRVRNPIDGEDA